MRNLEQLKGLMQFIDKTEFSVLNLDKAYNENNLKEINNIQQEIINFQKKISEIIKSDDPKISN